MTQQYECNYCHTEFSTDESTRRETMGDLDADKWQTICCPNCGRRVKTIFTPVTDTD